MDFFDTVKGSMLEGFLPAGWDMKKIDRCCSAAPETAEESQPFWNKGFTPVKCDNLYDFSMMMGHEIALEIKKARDEGRKLIMIFPVGPMGMYKWVIYFLREWNVGCGHVYGFNMDEWSDGEGNTLESSNPASFQYAMENSFYGPLGQLTIPADQRNFATRANLPSYPDKIAALKADGAKMDTIYGVGRMCHVAFWEPFLAAEFASAEEWKKAPYRLGTQLHPLTVEQNAITSFKSRTPLVPCRANTIGPGLFLQSDRMIGGCDGAFNRGMQWQGMSFWMTLRYGPDIWVTSSFVPTIAGKLFYLKELAGPLVAECN
ncbi:MAG: glucosamine-6-phosphate isomerase [Clostridia bacterium]|nr:glucosamine-6-phosphate isomerase [Clostridia bacterium]MDR3644907.1 glucosamine-6-phosphate isomerase [Clostridia bacterium]